MALNLPMPRRQDRIVKDDGTITDTYYRDQLAFKRKIEEAINGIAATVAALSAVDAALVEVDAALIEVSDATVAAQTAADDTTAQNNLTNSYPSTNPLSASDAGANATITIAGHDRIYGDGTSVAITGGSLTGLAYSTEYFVYYDDATRAGGAVTFASTTSATTAAQTGDRHLVGSVTTPAAAAPPTTGEAVQPPGVGDLR